MPSLDSTGVAALLPGAAEAVGRGVTLRVADPQPVVARVLHVTALGACSGSRERRGRDRRRRGGPLR